MMTPFWRSLLRELLIAIVLIVCVLLWMGWRNCGTRHGHYVRGLFWMECVR